ncbi:MAG: 4-hydroxy-tetrahydrodipicolinate synthase [Crocinitomicaceae bacterium]|nr:4-hydroxy-tetrahydrodipicolinate synthase [Crocinitomicaceae bacterium]MDG1777364.1 4-hydroxy-tetrahydrodipicolinate synthase [Crocinitomicaceae bacterium]
MNNPFKGSGVALVTPFNEDLTIDFTALKQLVRYQIENGTDFLVVQGTTGESPVLSMAEKLEVLKTVQEENDGQLKVVFGVGGNDTVAVGEILKQLPSGIDGILSVSPYYNKPTQKGIVEHYRYISACTPLPIILYNVPGRTGSNVSAETTLELAEIENIVAMKEASGSFEQIMEIIQNKPEGFDVLSGDDAITMPLITVGVAGVISVVANAFPKRFSSMVHNAIDQKTELAKKDHYALFSITNMLFEEGNPGGVKVALAAQNIMKPFMRRPLHPVSDGLKVRIEKETKKILS